MVKTFKMEGNEIGKKNFTIRKHSVIDALRWLKKYSTAYKDIKICPSNLDWMENESAALLPTTTIFIDPQTTNTLNEDYGPSKQTNYDQSTTEPVFGFRPQNNAYVPGNTKDKMITEKLQQAAGRAGKSMNFPYISPQPVSEYDASICLFPKAFPWLFPGGQGDFYQYKEEHLTVQKWAKRLLLYEDGRFAKDKMWCFFVLDFITRRNNKTAGNYFVDGFFKEGPKTLQTLQESIANGDTSWLNRMAYWGQKVPGTSLSST